MIDEFSAHKANVNCLKLGRGSGVALVTGGDDNKVNIWKLGHSHPAVVNTFCIHFVRQELIVCIVAISRVESDRLCQF